MKVIALLGMVLVLCIALVCWALPNQFDSQNLFGREELLQLANLRAKAESLPGGDDSRAVHWITQVATDVELLRFIRHYKNSDVDSLYVAIKKHVAWRTSPLGVETVSRPSDVLAKKHAYEQLAHEVFWMGVSKTGW